MGKGMKQKTRDKLVFVLCITLFLALSMIVDNSGRFGLQMFNGVFLACEFALCLLMIRRNNKMGIIVSMILMGWVLLSTLKALVFAHQTATLPGLGNAIIYIATLLMLWKQFKTREQEAVTDILTGLSNRRGLYGILKKKTEDEKPFHLICLDLDNFKAINDNYGHVFGDALLNHIADQIANMIGEGDIVARLGGTEFVVIIDGAKDPKAEAMRLIDAVSSKVALSVEGVSGVCYLEAFAGIASFPEHARTYKELLKYADIALYRAIKASATKFCVFETKMQEGMNRNMEVEKLIKEGLEKDYFYLVYQPQFAIGGKKLRGFETLLRLKTPDGVFASPAEFIPVAERGDLILQIDNYVLHRVMKEFKEIVTGVGSDLTISVNVSAKNISADGFVENLAKIMEETKFPAKNLEIEITEYCMVQSVDITIENIKKMRNLGIQVALDDFGTGYTSLSYLAKMPINLLKVDKSLVDDIEKDQKSKDFVKAVIAMGHMMGCEVISEGVETEKQLAILGDQQCDFIQGYVWGKPLDYEVAKELAMKG